MKKQAQKLKQENIIKLPLWLLDIDDFALLLDVDDQTQLPIIEKALRLVTVFAGNSEETRIYKNDIIAKAILEVLYSGGQAAQIHDQIFAILTSFNTPDLNLETPIYQPGYTRPLKQCLLIDNTGKIREMELLTNFINGFLVDDLELNLPDGSFKYICFRRLRDHGASHPAGFGCLRNHLPPRLRIRPAGTQRRRRHPQRMCPRHDESGSLKTPCHRLHSLRHRQRLCHQPSHFQEGHRGRPGHRARQPLRLRHRRISGFLLFLCSCLRRLHRRGLRNAPKSEKPIRQHGLPH